MEQGQHVVRILVAFLNADAPEMLCRGAQRVYQPLDKNKIRPYVFFLVGCVRSTYLLVQLIYLGYNTKMNHLPNCRSSFITDVMVLRKIKNKSFQT